MILSELEPAAYSVKGGSGIQQLQEKADEVGIYGFHQENHFLPTGLSPDWLRGLREEGHWT